MNHRSISLKPFVFAVAFSFAVMSVISASPVALAAEEYSSTSNPDTTEQAGMNTQAIAEPEIPRTFGIGLRVGGTHFGVGANARFWSNSKLGFEVGYSRFSVGQSSTGISYDASVNQISPSLLYAISELDWLDYHLRPYVGVGINLSRSSLEVDLEGLGLGSEKESSTNVGGQGFAGLELTFKQIPRLSFGADLGYYSTSTPFSGIKIGGFFIGAAIHYFVK